MREIIAVVYFLAVAAIVAATWRRAYRRGREDSDKEAATRDGYFTRQAILEQNLRGLQTTVNSIAHALQELDTRFTDALGSEEAPWDVVEKLERSEVVQEVGEDRDDFFARHNFQ